MKAETRLSDEEIQRAIDTAPVIVSEASAGVERSILEAFEPKQEVAEAVEKAKEILEPKKKKLKKLHASRFPGRAKSWKSISLGGSIDDIIKRLKGISA